jgi:hypothetical protein
LPITQQAKLEEHNRPKFTARNNWHHFSKVKLHMDKSQSLVRQRDNHQTKWGKFAEFGTQVRTVNKLFKHTNI